MAWVVDPFYAMREKPTLGSGSGHAQTFNEDELSEALRRRRPVGFDAWAESEDDAEQAPQRAARDDVA
jgi:hypothetical protein